MLLPRIGLFIGRTEKLRAIEMNHMGWIVSHPYFRFPRNIRREAGKHAFVWKRKRLRRQGHRNT